MGRPRCGVGQEGDWNDSTAIAAALKGVEGAFVVCCAGCMGTVALITEKQRA